MNEHSFQIEPTLGTNRIQIEAVKELFDSKVDMVRFELTTAFSNLKELKASDLQKLTEQHAMVAAETARRLTDIENQIVKIKDSLGNYVPREVYDKDEGRLYVERREALTAREQGRRAINLAMMSALVSGFGIAASILLHYLR
jgi:hypothetical protein